MKTIRPWQLFEHLGSDRDVIYRIPTHKGVESETIMSLETLLLVSAARITNAKSILELGTCLGYNAFQMARNTNAQIITIDKEKKDFVFTGQERILWIQSDIFALYPGHFDMVFCDINYTPETLAKATEIAFGSDPKVIAWHDYGHPLIPHVKPFLDSHEEADNMLHIGDSWLVFWFKDGL